MRLYRLIKKPIVTEKTSNLELTNNTYVFTVDKRSTKIDIKKAIFELYGVEVSDVNMLNTREKFKSGKKGPQIRKRTTKKAYVKLKNSEDKIDFSILK
jgi:large subunit ribosomal protein L23